jgi:hypothetical protein
MFSRAKHEWTSLRTTGRLQLERTRELAGVEATAEHMPVEMEDALPAAFAHVDEHLVVVEASSDRGVGHESEHACRLLVGERVDVTERVDVACRQDEQVRLGDRVDVADCNETVGRMHVLSSATSVQKRQFSRGDGKDPLLRDTDGPRMQKLSDLAGDEPRRVVVAVATTWPIDENAIRAPELRRPATARGSSESARSRALRSFLTTDGTGSTPSVPVPGRGEYGKTCRRESPTCSTTSSVRRNASSSSDGKPTITSAVRLKSSSDARRRR